MKKLLSLLIFLLPFVVSFSQPVVQRSTGSNTPLDVNLFVGRSFKVPCYSDTSAANANTPVLDSSGRMIFTYDVNGFWYRQASPKKWVRFTSPGSIVTNLTIINQIDSSLTIQICTVAGSCDTLTLITNINNVTEISFRDDSTIIVCDNLDNCDTLHIPQQNLIFQNGLGSIAAGVVEFGANPLIHPTVLDQNGNKMTFLDGVVQIVDGTQGAGKVFTSDTAGNGSWQIFSDPLIDGVVDGMIVTWDSLLTFDVSAGHFNKGGVQYAVPFTVITLDTLIGSDPRQDAFIATIFPGLGVGTDSSLTGIPDANPLVPGTDPIEQQILTSVLINAGDNVPSGILQTVIYDENIEWTTAAGPGQTANFGDVAFPIHLVKDINVSAIASNRYIQFTNSSTIDLNNYFALKLYIRNKSVMANNVRLTFRWMNGNTFITTNVVALGGNAAPFNYSRTTINAYQVITIPIPSFVNTSTIVDRLRITFTGTNAQGFYIDWVQLQGGFTQGGGGNPTGVTSVAMTGNIVFTPIVTNPTTTVSIANPLANAAANTFLGNQTSSSAAPTYSPIDLSQNANFANTLNPILITGGANGSFLQTLSGVVQWVSLPGGYDTTFVLPPLFVLRGSNRDTIGIHLIAGTNITLDSTANGTTINSTAGLQTLQQTFNTEVGGSVLTKIDSIQAGAFSLRVYGSAAALNTFQSINSSSGTGVYGQSSSGVGGAFVSTSGNGVTGTSTSSTGGVFTSVSDKAASFTIVPATTNTVAEVMRLARSTSGTAANNIGGSIDLFAQTVASGTVLANQIKWQWLNATFGTRTSNFIIAGLNSSVANDVFTISGTGAAKLNKYGIGTFTGTAAYTLQVDASGNIIEGSASGGGGFTTADNGLTANTATNVRLGGTLLANTTITGGANTLISTGSGSNTMYVENSGGGTALIVVGDNQGMTVAGTDNTSFAASSEYSSTNAVERVIQFGRTATGTAANGEGLEVAFVLEAATGGVQTSNTITSEWTDAALATRTSKMIFTGVNNASANPIMTMLGNGNVGIGATPSVLFQVTSGGNDLISADDVNFETIVKSTDGTARTSLDMKGDLVGLQVSFNLFADNDTDPPVSILGDAIAQTITLTSATTNISNLAGTGTRAVLASATGDLSAPVSDISTKQFIEPLDYGIETLMKFRPVSFEYRDEFKQQYGTGTQIGFIAQDIQQILPNSVYTNFSNGKLGYNETDIIPILTRAVQEQQLQIEELKIQMKKLLKR